MHISSSRRIAAVVCLGAALALTACGQERADPAAAGSSSSNGAGPSPSATRSPLGPQGNVETDSPDGAPHYGENNGYKVPKDVSPASEKAARAEAARIKPVIKKLRKDKVWAPQRVRAALLELGYQSHRPNGELVPGMLLVSTVDSIWESDHYVTPEGAQFALRVREDACVVGHTTPTSYSVGVNGLYMETGCFSPPSGH